MALGGMIPVYLLSKLFEWAIFKRVVDLPELGKALSVGFAVMTAIAVYGFGNADGGPWNPFPGGISYIISGAIVLPLMLWFYHRREAAKGEDTGLGDVFE